MTSRDGCLRIAAVGVNFLDVYHRMGLYPLPAPFTPGSEAAGTVPAPRSPGSVAMRSCW